MAAALAPLEPPAAAAQQQQVLRRPWKWDYTWDALPPVPLSAEERAAVSQLRARLARVPAARPWVAAAATDAAAEVAAVPDTDAHGVRWVSRLRIVGAALCWCWRDACRLRLRACLCVCWACWR